MAIIFQTKELEDYKLIREISTSVRLKAYLARDKNDVPYVLSWLDRDKLLTHYMYQIHDANEELPLEEVKKQAMAKRAKREEEFVGIYRPLIGLSHPNVAKIYKIVHDDAQNLDIVVSEYVPGDSIFHGTRGLTPPQMFPIFGEMFGGIDFEHELGLLNLNLKETSFRVNLQAVRPIVKLIDYGSGMPITDYRGGIRGTPLYMAPEVIMQEKEKIDRRADLYSGGVIMYHSFTGQFPFEGRRSAGHDMLQLQRCLEREQPPCPLKHYREDIPDQLQELVLTLLKPDPNDRKFKNGAEIVMTFYKYWPEASKEIIPDHTITVTDGSKQS